MRSRLLPRHIATPALLLASCYLLLGSDGPSQLEEPDGPALIAELGHGRWSRREEACRRVLELGEAVLPLLRDAVTSDNAERAYRAVEILDQLDPLVLDLDVLELRLDNDGPALPIALASSIATAEPGVSLTPTPLDGVAGDSDEQRSTTYTIRRRGSVAEAVSLSAEEESNSSGVNGLALHRPLGATRAVSILKRSEECAYQNVGERMTRTRRRSMTLLLVHQRRELSDDGGVLSRDASAVREELVTRLLEQALPPSGTATELPDAVTRRSRANALEILVALRSPRADIAFRLALDTPGLRDLALLGLDDLDALEQMVSAADALLEQREDERAIAGGERSVSAAAPDVRVVVAAAERLLAHGRESALEFVLDELVRADPYTLHSVMSLLSDTLEQQRLSTAARRRIIDTALGQEFLSRAVWSLQETEYLIATAIAGLDPANPAGRARAAALQSTIERLYCGDLGTTPLSYTTFFDLWKRAQRRAGQDPAAEAFLAVSLLPCMARSQQLALAQKAIERALSQGLSESDRTLEEFLELLRAHVETDDETVRQGALQLLLSAARSLELRPDWLAPMVRALVDARTSLDRPVTAPSGSPRRTTTARSMSTLRLGLDRELARWSGVRLSARGLRDDGVEARWKAWFEDAAGLASRQEELRDALSTRREGERESYLYTFSLRLRAQSESAISPEEPPAPEPYAVLDGRSLRLVGLEPTRYQDAFGDWHQVQIASARSNAASRYVQVRIDGATYQIPQKQPLLRTWIGSAPSVMTYETSDVYFGSRYVSRPRQNNYRLLLFHDDSPPPAELAAASPSRLLDWLIDNCLIPDPPAASPQHVQQVAAVLEALRPERARTYLLETFRREPSPGLAKALGELGESTAVDYLRALLESEEDIERREAALYLVELGERDGVPVLLEDARQRAASTIGRALGAFDRYLAERPERDELRRDILDLFFGLLPQPSWQYRAFRTLEREIGRDFGYREAQRANPDDPSARKQAFAEAVARAQAWWRTQRESYLTR